MAVTVEGTPTNSGTFVGTSVTWSHTTGATATGLWVGVCANGNLTVSSVTFNGDALTELFDRTSTGVVTVAGYLMVSPDITTANIVATISASAAGAAGGVGLAGLETASVAAAHRTVYGTSDTAGGPSTTVVDSVNGDLVIDAAMTFNATITVGAGQTSRCENDGLSGSNVSFGVSTEAATGASTVMNWTSGDINVSGATALIAAAAGGGGNPWNAYAQQ
jgi:hypothetical protein